MKLNNKERKEQAAVLIRQLSEKGLSSDDVRKIFSTAYSLAKARRPEQAQSQSQNKPKVEKQMAAGRLSTPPVKP